MAKKPEAAETTDAAEPAVKTVKMRHAGKDFLADVHPDEVDNWFDHGWRLVKDEPAPEEPAA